MSDDDRVMVGARLPEWQKQALSRDDRTIQEIITTAVQRELGVEDIAELRRERAELNSDIARLEEKIENWKITLEDKRDRLEVVNAQIDRAVNEGEQEREQILSKFDMIPVEEDGVDHPFVQEAAEELDVTPEEAIEMWEEME